MMVVMMMSMIDMIQDHVMMTVTTCLTLCWTNAFKQLSNFFTTISRQPSRHKFIELWNDKALNGWQGQPAEYMSTWGFPSAEASLRMICGRWRWPQSKMSMFFCMGSSESCQCQNQNMEFVLHNKAAETVPNFNPKVIPKHLCSARCSHWRIYW